MELRLQIFQSDPYLSRQSVFYVTTHLIDVNNYVIKSKKVFHHSMNDLQLSFLERILYGVYRRVVNDVLGLDFESNLIEISQNIYERLPNTLLNIQGFIIEVESVAYRNDQRLEIKEMINSGSLVFNPHLTGFRYYMYYWFKSTLVLGVAIISFYLFFAYYSLKVIYNLKEKDELGPQESHPSAAQPSRQ